MLKRLNTFQGFHLAVIALGLFSSYATFLLYGKWEFGGVAKISPLKPLALHEYSAMVQHVLLTLFWMIGAHYNLATKGTGSHVWVGRLSIFVGSLMWFVAPESQQMSSCWPVDFLGKKTSVDAASVLALVLVFSLNLGLGWYSVVAKSSYQSLEDHKLFMYLSMWSTLTPALMRILCFIPGFYFASQRPAAQETLLTLGQWLWTKEMAYCALTVLHLLPFFNPEWSPYAKMAFSDGTPKSGYSTTQKIFAGIFLAFMAHRIALSIDRALNYSTEVGLLGGEKCDVFLGTFYTTTFLSASPSVIPNTTLGMQM